jgi:hypothetical protein
MVVRDEASSRLLIGNTTQRPREMRIHCKAAAPPDWAGLLRSWRDTEG